MTEDLAKLGIGADGFYEQDARRLRRVKVKQSLV